MNTIASYNIEFMNNINGIFNEPEGQNKVKPILIPNNGLLFSSDTQSPQIDRTKYLHRQSKNSMKSIYTNNNGHAIAPKK